MMRLPMKWNSAKILQNSCGKRRRLSQRGERNETDHESVLQVHFWGPPGVGVLGIFPAWGCSGRGKIAGANSESHVQLRRRGRLPSPPLDRAQFEAIRQTGDQLRNRPHRWRLSKLGNPPLQL